MGYKQPRSPDHHHHQHAAMEELLAESRRQQEHQPFAASAEPAAAPGMIKGVKPLDKVSKG